MPLGAKENALLGRDDRCYGQWNTLKVSMNSCLDAVNLLSQDKTEGQGHRDVQRPYLLLLALRMEGARSKECGNLQKLEQAKKAILPGSVQREGSPACTLM